MSQKVNLNAYFERIGFAGSIAPTLATLEQIHALHAATIPFENLDSLLGTPIALDLASISKKLLSERRGGYCFEHNLLLMAVLRELDFSVRGFSARVLWNNPNAADAPASHMLVAVDIGGSTYIADPGFGGLALTAPLRLKADVEQATPHNSFRLTGGDPEWMLEALIGEEWRPLYAFTQAERTLADYEAANQRIADDAQSPFKRELRVSLAPEGRRLRLRDSWFTVQPVGSAPETRLLTNLADMRAVLTESFGIALPSSEALDPKLEEIIARSAAQQD